MASIQLYDDCPVAMTSISNKFIDEYMPEANGEFVKVYLYLLRSVGNHASDCSISAIADCFNHTEKDVMRALKYWERMHLIRLDTNSDRKITGIHLLDIDRAATDYSAGKYDNTPVRDEKVSQETDMGSGASEAHGIASAVTSGEASTAQVSGAAAAQVAGGTSDFAASNVTPIRTTAARKEYTADEIKNFCTDPNVTELFFIIETYLKHPLSSTDTSTVLYWYDQLHFSSELIVYLVEYCISKGHSSMRYMDKVALGWHENHITTIEQAKENAAIHSQAYYGVMKALGITGRNLVNSEVAFVNKWSKEYAFDLPIIQEACSRTIAATHQPSFEYTDSILSNWYKNRVHTMEDVKKLDESYSKTRKTANTKTAADSAPTVKRNRFNNFNQREYDSAQLEQVFLNTSVQ